MREMRRKERQLTDEETKQLLQKENWGVLSVSGDDGFPYGVPVNYVFADGRIYIHCSSAESHKLDGIRRCSKVCFTVVPKDEMDAENLACSYESVIVFGIASILDGPEEKREAMECFMRGLAPELVAWSLQKCDPETPALSVIRIAPVMMTGKRGH
jgi:nitroimidazol reductase NimA-like FMN-containing flavoprotein (pyridoxamine 5'-phosphate oxidase superfamily)